jgi:DNA-binding Xre family transcriptional regulator
MQICMIFSSDGKRAFLTELQRRMGQRNWNISVTAKNVGIHQSQLSRIVAGQFKTFSSSIMKICISLGMEPKDYYLGMRGDEDRRQIADSAISIWDGTHRDAEFVAALLREIAKLRNPGSG